MLEVVTEKMGEFSIYMLMVMLIMMKMEKSDAYDSSGQDMIIMMMMVI